MNNEKKAAVIIGGGVGKHIAFSSLIPSLREKYGDITLVNSYPMIFHNNPDVYRNYTTDHQFLYEDHLSDLDVYKVEPYDSNEYRKEKMHLIDTYAKLLKLDKYDKTPKLYISKQEEAETINFINNNIKTNYILLHIFGGVSLYTPQNVNQKQSFSRDYPIELAQELVYKIRQKYPGLAVLQIGFQTEPMLKDVININNAPIRSLFPLVKYCKTFIGIDSCVQHISAAFNKKGIVLWGGTDPTKLGYDHNINLEIKQLSKCKETHCHRPDTYFFDNEAQRLWTCPHDYECMKFSTDVILEQFDNIMGESVKK